MRTLLMALLLATGAAKATTYHVIASGLGGQPEYEQRFNGLAQDLGKLVAGAGSDVQVLKGADATRSKLKAALDRVATVAKAEDSLVVTLIGHGTFDGADYKFNVTGPDVTAAELRSWLEKVPGVQTVVLATSSSGGAIDTLKRQNRVLVTATRSGMERNAVVFARYWVEAFRDANADADKSQTVSALEAYRYADKKTAEFFTTQKRLATEHAMLEDTGAGEAQRAPSVDNGQGLLAGRTMIARFGAVQEALKNPEKQKLLARKEEIEQGIDKLKYEKAAMPSAEYRKELASLLLELAKLQEEIDK